MKRLIRLLAFLLWLPIAWVALASSPDLASAGVYVGCVLSLNAWLTAKDMAKETRDA